MRYDPFQEQAIDLINQGHSVIVAAPTGAGKTAIAEHVIAQCLQRDEKVIYTAPIKALSNQKYRDFSKENPDKVGILTGDVTINAHAPTLIMTTEIFRNKIIEEHSDLTDYTWIIFDEMHYLDDIERGSVWEESMMFLPDHMNILGLSATIPNVKEIAEWLKSIHHRPVSIIVEKNRPVPLKFYFQCKGAIYDDLGKLKKPMSDALRTPYRYRSGRQRFDRERDKNRPEDIMAYLHHRDLLPCIFFSFGRRRTENLAESMKNFKFLSDNESHQVKEEFDRLCEKYEISHEPSTYDIKPLIERGIAYHHAGMLPTLKEVIEQLFTTKMIKAIFTTETFALGINMPARAVVFDELRKIYGNKFGTIKTRDFFQMAGRAGRRGMDAEGTVMVRVNPNDVAYLDLEKIIFSETEKVVSRFNASYATILNLYAQHGEDLYDIYPRSLHFYQEKKNKRKAAVRTLRDKVKLLKELGHIRKNRLTEKGLFAANIYGYELLVAELYAANVLEDLSVDELGMLALAIVFEPRKGTRKPRLSRSAKELQRFTNDLIFPILKMEHTYHIRPFSKPCHFHLSNALDQWMNNGTFEETMAACNADEGELVRYFRMAIQILREIAETKISDGLKKKIHETIRAINRDVIDAEKQLRA